MFGNISQYFSEKVLPDYKFYLKQRKNNKSGLSKDISTGIDSATSLYHFREHLENFCEAWEKTYDDLLELYPNYNLLGEVVNASKHAVRNKKNRKLTNAQNIYEEIIITTYIDKKGEYNHIQKEVLVKLDSGENVVLYKLLTEIVNMWIKELKSIGLFSGLSIFTESTRLPRRNKDSGKLDFITTQNFYGRRFKIQKYNYDTKTIEPIDLSDAEISAKFFKPQIIADLEITEKNGKKHNFEILVDQKQKKLIEGMKDINERNQFLIKLATEQNLITIKKQ
jgi:hypothetical protein